ncbi:ElaB/YqjD/DUF883 family membrane-anchored ribosome-binding protein [Lysobacter enzymogenes]|uniref:DUF883 family protein n=1 Tax=Lysobacter enzymogenes TaxID=69 RepID=UPI00339A65D6
MENIKSTSSQALKSAADKTIEGVSAVRTAVTEQAQTLGEAVRDRAVQAKDYGQDALDEMTYTVQERPWTSVAIALAVGVGIGYLVTAAARR